MRASVLTVLLAFSATSAPFRGPAAVQAAAQAPARTASLPERLSDADYWKLVTDLSEPGGYFRITDNYTSNEREVGQLFTVLRETKVQGGVYLGVGPEQNFTYIASIRPAMAFIVDIRRMAVMQHLMYKAMFELAKDRVEFISLLFGKPLPSGLEKGASIQKIWDAYTNVPSDPSISGKNYVRIVELLTKTKGFTFTGEESGMLEGVYQAFYAYGPSISTRGGPIGRGGGGSGLTFADLTGWMYDSLGQPQSFLSTDEHFLTVKRMHEKNLIVAVSGDFGGPKTIRAIGAYLKERGGVVSGFYVSNVEQYLFQDGKQRAFYDNVATLPANGSTVFIRPYSVRRGGGPPQWLCGIGDFIQSFNAGHIYSYNDSLDCLK
jgi:hypothetical protein